jgi:peroxiredoxin
MRLWFGPLRRKVVGIGLVAVAVWSVIVVVYSNDVVTADSTTLSHNEPTANSTADVGQFRYPVGHRRLLPSLQGMTLDGGRLRVADLLGHVVVLNVWGSWCEPCRDEANDLAKVARETSADGVRFVGVDTSDQVSSARSFVRSHRLPYPSLVDKDTRLLLALKGILPVDAVPSTVVVDSKGNVAARVIGKVDHETLRQIVDHTVTEDSEAAAGGHAATR